MPITLGLRLYVVIAVAIVLVLTVMGIALYPVLYVQYIQKIGIKRFETEYGVKSGTVATSSPPRPVSEWGLVMVAPDGKFAKLGMQVGDIPFEYHGGAADMYAALQQAEEGQPSSFQVYNVSDAHLGRSALRTIRLPASRKRP